jgi:hypothetical protein
MEEMVVVEDMFILWNKGLYFTLNLRVTSKQVMVEMEWRQSTGADGW